MPLMSKKKMLLKKLLEMEKMLVTMYSAISEKKLYHLSLIKLICKIYAFSLDKAKILSADNGLTHYHTMQHFHTIKIYSCGKHCERKRNCL